MKYVYGLNMLKKIFYLCLVIFIFAVVICVIPHTYYCANCRQACFSEPNIAFWFSGVSGDVSCIHDHCLQEWDGYDWKFPMKWPHRVYIQ